MHDPNSLRARVARITARLEEISKAETGKSEDFIDLKQGNIPGKRLKNVGGQGLDSLPKAGKRVGKDEGSGGTKKAELGKDEVPSAKPPSGKVPGAAPKPPMTGAPKVGGAPGGTPAGGMPKPASMAKPAMGKEELPSSKKTLPPKPPKVTVTAGGQPASGPIQRMYRQHQEQRLRTQFNALRGKAIREAGVAKSELIAGAAHHLNGLNLAISRRDDSVAQQHARLCVVYERLLGHDPIGAVDSEIEAATRSLAKREPTTGYLPFGKDRIVEDLFKNLLGQLPKATSLGSSAPALSLPGVKGPVKNASLRTSGSAGPAPHLSGLKAPQSIDFDSPNGVPAPKITIKAPPPGHTGANPMQPKPAGSVLASIRQKIFGSKTAAAAPPTAGMDKGEKKPKKVYTPKGDFITGAKVKVNDSTMKWKCPRCTKPNDDGDSTCVSCGQDVDFK